jgi:hypothetical protein
MIQINFKLESNFSFSYVNTVFCSLEKIDLIFDAKMESGVRYMAIVTCDLIKFEFNI